MDDALIHQYYAYYPSFNERRIADAAALFSRDAVVDHPPFTAALRGGDAYQRSVDTWLRAFPDARLSVEHIEWSYEAERQDYQDEGAGATVKGLVSVFTHFFTRTRWDRLLRQIR